MLNQTVLSFINKAENDPVLKNRLPGMGADVISEIAAEVNFHFKPEDWVSTVSALYSGELADTDLSKVSGGALVQQNPLGVTPSRLEKVIPNALGSCTYWKS